MPYNTCSISFDIFSQKNLYIQSDILIFVVWNVLSYANIRNNLYILSIADEQSFCGKFMATCYFRWKG